MSVDILKQLNSQQKKAVSHKNGPLLVLAGAGSGKTRVLTYRIAYLIDKFGVNPENVLAVTFTNKAAEEMKERVTKILNGLEKNMIISTFHSYCSRILRREIEKLGYESNYVIFDTTDQKKLVKEVMKELDIKTDNTNPGAVVGEISKAKNNLISPEDYQQKIADFFTQKVSKIYPLYQKELRNNNALDFGDLIMKTVELFENNSLVLEYYQERFKYILIDEYQDVNQAQYTLANLLAEKHRNICVVGDPDQSIYGFRGADINNILNFENDYPEARVIKLERNYRSKGNILEAAHSVIKNNSSRKEKKLWTDRGEGKELALHEAPTDKQEADYIAAKIKDLTEDRYEYGDIAILYRVNSLSRVLEERLMKYGIPYQMVGGLRFYDRMEIKDILAYFRVIYNPEDNISLLRIINKPKRGIGQGTIAKLQRYADKNNISLYQAGLETEENTELTGVYKKRVENFFKFIEKLRRNKNEISLVKLLDQILIESGYKKMLKEDGSTDSETRLENIKELYTVIDEFLKENEEASLGTFLEEISLLSDVDGMEDKTKAVTLMTLHAAKGLEFPVIFLTGMEEGIFPHSNSLMEPEEIEEERRLCYVGITRAMDELYITRSRIRYRFGSKVINPPSRFLQEIPEELFLGKEKNGNNNSGIEKPKYDNTKKEANNKSIEAGYEIGETIIHSKWGKGEIIDLKEDNGLYITAKFRKGKPKIMMAEYAPIQKV
ncbi:MAG: DNA helicase PcrA [Bacillota bacterium]